MKKTLAWILCLSILMVLFMAPLTTASANSYMYVNSYKNGRSVNLRSEAKAGDNIEAQLPHRAYVLVYQYNKQHTWAYIEATNPNGKGTVKGWISVEFLSKKDPGPFKKPEPAPEEVLANLGKVCAKIKPVDVPYTAEITTKNPTALVHLRWFPDTSAKYRDAFPRGTVVTVIAKGGKWTQVIYTPIDTEEQHVGFVLSDNVQEY